MKGLLLLVFVAVVAYVTRCGYVSAELKVECPKPLYGNISAAAHPCNCTVFYECKDGKKTAKLCPSPYQFNEMKQICDWPINAPCKIHQACLDTCTCNNTVSVDTPSIGIF